MKQYIYFNELPVGANFSLNGNQWRKRSTRTAEIVGSDYAGTWFYFKQRELAIVGLHSRL